MQGRLGWRTDECLAHTAVNIGSRATHHCTNAGQHPHLVHLAVALMVRHRSRFNAPIPSASLWVLRLDWAVRARASDGCKDIS
eukprot:6210763-Pleurochrysis_carterae.AAC.1